MAEDRFTVAIDGPAAAGKGTIAKAVAAHFGFAHLDSGLLYRATGRRMLAGEDAIDAAQALHPDDLNVVGLRTAEVAAAASVVAAVPEVRAALVDFQRRFARREGGAVVDGRDIGTVICPEAEVKFYVTASDAVRAGRRHAELVASGSAVTQAEVLAALQDRDQRDASRDASPMRPAEDAILLDTTKMTIEQAVAAAIAAVQARLP